MSDTFDVARHERHEDPRTRVVKPSQVARMRMMPTGRERAAIAAMAALREAGAHPVPTHRLSNGLGFIAPETGRRHGPAAVRVTYAGVPCFMLEHSDGIARIVPADGRDGFRRGVAFAPTFLLTPGWSA